MRRKLLKVFVEHPNERRRLGIVGGSIRPGIAWVQDFGVYTIELGGNLETEHRIGAHRLVLEFSRKRSIQQRAGSLDRHARAGTEFASGPAGIDQPAVNLVIGNELAQQVAVNGGMPRHERCAKARRKRRLRLIAHALFRTSHLGGEAGKEVVHGLRWRQFGYWRQDREGICGQHDNIAWVPGSASLRCIRNKIQRIARARVLSQAAIIEIGFARLVIENHVFQYGAKTVRCFPDFRFGLC